jgi:hypothetical protein
MPRLFLLEDEYRNAMMAAEIAWLEGTIAELSTGVLTWSEAWIRQIAKAQGPSE